MSNIGEFGKSAVSLGQSPLGIVALFIVFVYAVSALFLAFSGNLDALDRHLIVGFMLIFPICVLSVFYCLVSFHYTKLFGPGSFKNEDNYMKMVEVAVSLTAAAGKDRDSMAVGDLQKILKTAEIAARHPVALTDARRRILWVDDRPENNIYERSAFEAIGIEFTLALTTNQALELAEDVRFEAVISDMGRKEGPREGYVLLDALRKRNDKTPFFIYAGSNSIEHKHETQQHGGQGCTNNGQELFELVVKSLITKT